jgi:hypothetical protein
LSKQEEIDETEEQEDNRFNTDEHVDIEEEEEEGI